MGVFIMIIKTTHKMATSLIIISSLMALPNISYSKEVKNEDFLAKLLSSFTSKNETPKTTQIFEADIKSIKLTSIDDFEFSIKDVLKNYFDIKTVNKIINNISSEDDKTIQAKNIEEFLKLLPKSPSDKVNGAALIRLANQLSTDLKTIYEIKRNIAFQFVQSQGITLVLNDKTERPKITEVKKEEELDTKEASSSNMPIIIGGIAGLGALGGGGGGSSSGTSSSTTFLDETTSFSYDASLDNTWTARTEYNNSIYGAGTWNGQGTGTSTINPYTLVGINNAYARGLSGSGKVIAIYDTDYHLGTHKEFTDKNNASKITNDGTLTAGSDGTSWHGIHVSGTIAGDYNSNNSNFLSGAFGDDRDYGMMGVAYNASLHLSDFADTSVYTNSQDRLNAAITAAKNKNSIAQNNSWGWGTCLTGSGCTTIDELVTYQNNNSTSDSASMTGIFGGNTSKWADMITAYQNFQNTGVIVFANGNDYNSANASLQPGLPVVATELADAWLTVGNLNIVGGTISSGSMKRVGNQCGVAAEFCIFADGTDIWSSTGDTNTSTNNEYSTYTGSSMAAPIVSGAVALLSEAFPNHTPEQLVDRILASANNDFYSATGTTTFINGITHGYNSEFGHGLLDLATALGPIQTSSIILSASGTSNLNTRYGNIDTARRFNISESNVRLGSAFGDSISNALNGKKAYFYDSLNGGFAFNMGTLVKNYESKNSSMNNFTQNIYKSQFHNKITKDGLGFLTETKSIENNNLMTFIPVSKDNTAFFGNNINIQNSMSFAQRGDNEVHGIKSDNPFSIPFMNASEKGTSFGNTINLGEGKLTFGLFDGETKDYGLKTDGLFLSYSKNIKNSNASVFIGSTKEDDGFLETSISGAFAEQSFANTNYIGSRSYGWLNNNWSYNSLITLASTNLDIDRLGLLKDIDNIKSSMFALEVAKTINADDSFHIGLYQPLRIEKGNASIMIPKLYDIEGNLNFETSSFELDPSGRQIDLSIGYRKKVSKIYNIGITMSASKDYQHVKSEEIINSASAYIKFDF